LNQFINPIKGSNPQTEGESEARLIARTALINRHGFVEYASPPVGGFHRALSPVAPGGPGRLHEIKHDGFRILARRDGAGVRLITRTGNDFSSRFPFIAMAVAKLPIRSCLIDGEAIVCDENGLAVFELIRRHGALASAVLCAFDLLELDGRDLRREPIEERKRLLAKLLKGQQMSVVFNEVYEEDGAIVFREACELGCEGIVSKRLGSMYRRGRSPHWIKVKNPNASAVKREAEEDWGR
jgi:bifunctional non-homologous end joining protein LigD